MSLAPGAALAHYRLAERIGAGGMGEVWRAIDTTLGRDVAIKFLPAAFASDPERLTRFEREARLLASLNHPSIATVHGFHQVDGVRFLAMELVSGEDLAERLKRGRLTAAEAIDVARQTAEALEAAHEHGIVHRDLKPANVKLTAEGRVKVLDFGLAKAAEGAATGPSDTGLSPTVTSLGTVAGVILGTAAYMSPEQARGKPVDKRADVWAFGCVLFEMLAGRRPFDGETVSDTLAAVLARDPDWSAIPEATPARVRELIARCLVKDPKRRLRDVGEARIELENALDSRTSSGTLRVPAPVTPRAPLTLALGAVAVAAVAFAAWAFLRPAPAAAPAPVTRLHVERPPGELNTGTGTFALSPDGRAVVFVVLGNTDTPRLWVRELDDPAGRDLPGTEGAALPFWSPDARDIAFFADGKLKRVPRSGGGVRTVCEAANARGGAWGASGVIIFSANPFGPLFKVAADGGVPEPATTLDAARKQDSHRFPSFLPDGRGFVYAVLPQVEQGLMQNEIASLDDPSGKPLLLASNAARYAPPGYMLFARDQALMAQRIDLATGRMEGEIIPLADRPELFPRITGTPGVDCAADGTIVYDETDRRATDAVWMSRDGRRLEKAFTHPGAVIGGFLAPRGDRLVLGSIGDPDLSIVVVDLATGSETRVVRPDRRPRGFAWSPVDGRLLLYVRDGDGESIASVDPDGGPERIVLPLGRRYAIPSTAAPDGTIVLNELVAGGRYDIVYLPRGEGTETRAYLATDANEEESVLSPDGGLLAYTSDASGRTEVYVDAFPAHREARRVSSGGGSLPRWRRDGRELYFLSANGRNLLACDVTVSPSFALGTPRALFELPQDVRSILPAPKGDKFLMLVPVGPPRTALTVVQNWSAQLD